MTTYPLSEPATIRRIIEQGATDQPESVVARGSLADCAEILEGWSTEERAAVQIDIDDMSRRYGPAEVEELLTFLREEDAEPDAV